MINSYKDLIVWQKAVVLVENVYTCTKSFPQDELFSLVNQMRRSAVSIPSNIAEGRGRGTRKDFVNFLYMAQGSLFELETQTHISRNLGYLKDSDYQIITLKVTEIGKMLHGMIKKLRTLS